jgi:hypothetical protein
MGIPFFRAARAAIVMASIHGPLSVPMLRTSAEASPAISSTSSTAWAMTGDAPSASRALAVVFIAT